MENRATLFVLKSDGKYVSGVTPLGVLTTTDEIARAAFLCERDVKHLDKVFAKCTLVRVECVLHEQQLREAKTEKLEKEAAGELRDSTINYMHLE